MKATGADAETTRLERRLAEIRRAKARQRNLGLAGSWAFDAGRLLDLTETEDRLLRDLARLA